MALKLSKCVELCTWVKDKDISATPSEGRGFESQPRSSRVFLYLPGMGLFTWSSAKIKHSLELFTCLNYMKQLRNCDEYGMGILSLFFSHSII